MELLYEDRHLWVAVKPPDLLSEATPDHTGFADLLAEQNQGYVGVIHRLDRGVGGVMVYAKTPLSAAKLSKALQDHQIQKEYWAVVCGVPPKESDTLCDLLFHDRNANKTYAVTRERRGVKKAVLDYKIMGRIQTDDFGHLSLLRIRLHTGRTHQIRAQFSSRGLPLLGDRKYGSPYKCPIALFACALAFPHPANQKILTFEKTPAKFPWDLFSV